jgi:hypothetical protein
MKRIKLNLAFIFCCLIFVACNKEEGVEKATDLIGNWVNNQQDTLLFTSESFVEYKPRIATVIPFFYFCRIIGDTVTLQLTHSSNSEDWTNHYFKYSEKQIEIHDFQYRERDFYKRIK